jgi:hypothetical protein
MALDRRYNSIMRRSGFRNSAAISRLKALRTVVESFVRSDSLSLGKTNSGATWTNIRGAWAIASNKASTSTAASSYPISVLTFTDEDVTISVGGVGPGMGTAFWVTDSNNWWGAYVDVVQSCSTCMTAGNVATYAYAYVSGGNCATYSTVPGNCATYSTVPGNCSTYSTVPGNCSTWSTVNANCATYSTVPGNCSTWSTSCSYPCNATNATAYPCNAFNKSYPCNATNAVVPGNCASANASNCASWNAASGGNCASFSASCSSYTTNCTSFNAASGGNCASSSSSCSSYYSVPAYYNARIYQCYPGAPGNGAGSASCGLTYAQAQACGGCKVSSELIPRTYPCSTWGTTCNAYNPYVPGNCAAFAQPCSSYTTNCGSYNPYVASTCSSFNASNCNAFNAATGGNCSTWSTVNANCATYSTVPGNCSTWSTSCSYPCNATNATAYPCNAFNKSYPCNATNATNYPCNAYNATYYPCATANAATYPCNVYNPITYSTIATSYNAATYYTCNCVDNYKINIVKMIAGTLTNVATFSFASAIASFKAILSGSTITVQAFTGSNWTTQIGSNQSTTLSGYTKTKKHGILKGVVTYSPVETSTIDEFRVG